MTERGRIIQVCFEDEADIVTASVHVFTQAGPISDVLRSLISSWHRTNAFVGLQSRILLIVILAKSS
jgi:hypothetical protein